MPPPAEGRLGVVWDFGKTIWDLQGSFKGFSKDLGFRAYGDILGGLMMAVRYG